MKPHNKAVTQLEESVFTTMTQLANKHQAINLAQGFPDFDGPQWAIELARESLLEGKNQYAPSMGLPVLREALAGLYQRLYGLNFDPPTQIMVTNGATEAIYSTIKALVNPGDEVVIFEPFYDSYYAALQMAQADIKIVTLHAPHFGYDEDELKKTINEKTKLLIINNPHNPSGKVFERPELEFIAKLATKFDFYVMSDEVYEHLVFEKKHLPFASIEDMAQRTITISSMGKTLSVTGWKIGWAIAPQEILKSIHNTRQFISFSVATPLQSAVAKAIGHFESYLPEFREMYQAKRDLLCQGLKDVGLDVSLPDGTYFCLVHLAGEATDLEACQKLITQNKVASIPTSAFYKKSKQGQKILRFCFAKKEETLQEAIKNLSSLKGLL